MRNILKVCKAPCYLPPRLGACLFLVPILTACTGIADRYSASVVGTVSKVEDGEFYSTPQSSATIIDGRLYGLTEEEYSRRYNYTLQLENGTEIKTASPNKMAAGYCAVFWHKPNAALGVDEAAPVPGYLTHCEDNSDTLSK